MSSNKQKRQQLRLRRVEREAERERAESLARRSEVEREKAALLPSLRKGTVIAVDPARIVSRSAVPRIPDYYRDTWFTCKACGARELWTARQQQRWYEEQGGEIEAIAVRCRACRRQEKLRRATARMVHLDGLARKRKATAGPTQNG